MSNPVDQFSECSRVTDCFRRKELKAKIINDAKFATIKADKLLEKLRNTKRGEERPCDNPTAKALLPECLSSLKMIQVYLREVDIDHFRKVALKFPELTTALLKLINVKNVYSMYESDASQVKKRDRNEPESQHTGPPFESTIMDSYKELSVQQFWEMVEKAARPLLKVMKETGYLQRCKDLLKEAEERAAKDGEWSNDCSGAVEDLRRAIQFYEKQDKGMKESDCDGSASGGYFSGRQKAD
jgi:hypothetical protein